MIKSMRNKLLAMLCVAVMTLGIITPSFMNTVQAAVAQRTVYVDVEKNVLGGNLLHEPKKVTLDETATILDATKQVAGEDNLSIRTDKWGVYLVGVKDSETVNKYPIDFTETLEKVSNGVICKSQTNQPIVEDSKLLCEKEYTGISGWMFTINNVTTDKNGKFCTAATKLSDIDEGAVIRWEFSEAMGADLGLANSAYIPTAVTTDGYYDWNSSVPLDAFFVRANKSELIRAMADHKGHPAYENALEVLKTLKASKDEVDTVVTSLTSINPQR